MLFDRNLEDEEPYKSEPIQEEETKTQASKDYEWRIRRLCEGWHAGETNEEIAAATGYVARSIPAIISRLRSRGVIMPKRKPGRKNALDIEALNGTKIQ